MVITMKRLDWVELPKDRSGKITRMNREIASFLNANRHRPDVIDALQETCKQVHNYIAAEKRRIESEQEEKKVTKSTLEKSKETINTTLKELENKDGE